MAGARRQPHQPGPTGLVGLVVCLVVCLVVGLVVGLVEDALVNPVGAGVVTADKAAGRGDGGAATAQVGKADAVEQHPRHIGLFGRGIGAWWPPGDGLSDRPADVAGKAVCGHPWAPWLAGAILGIVSTGDLHLGDKPGSNLMLEIPCMATQQPVTFAASRSPARRRPLTGWPARCRGWRGRKGLPAGVVRILNAAGNKALQDPEQRERMLDQGNEIGGGTPALSAALIKAEARRWGKVVKDAKIEPG